MTPVFKPLISYKLNTNFGTCARMLSYFNNYYELKTFFNIKPSLMLPTDGGEYSTVLNGIMMIGNMVQSLRD